MPPQEKGATLLLLRLQEVAHLRVLCFKFEFLNPSKYNDTQHLDFIVGIKFKAFMQNNKNEVPILSHVFNFVLINCYSEDSS